MSKYDNLQIRKLIGSDFEHWKECWRAYLDFYETALDEDMIQLAWQRLMSGNSHEFQGIGAFGEDQQMAGLVHFLYHRHGWKRDQVCYLQDLFVHQKYRRQSIAEKLIHSVYEHAKQQNACQVYWLTQDFNTAARKLYDKISKQTPFIKYQYDVC